MMYIYTDKAICIQQALDCFLAMMVEIEGTSKNLPSLRTSHVRLICRPEGAPA